MKRLKIKTEMCLLILVSLLLLGIIGNSHVHNRRAKAEYNDLSARLDAINDLLVESNDKSDTLLAKRNYSFDYSWTKTSPLIAHAFGAIDGITYTNSLEAFEHNYSLGHRIFEVDFDVTDEGVLILAHDEASWRLETGVSVDVPYTYENYINTPLYDKYTSLDYQDLLQLMIEYPDIYIVTDTKYYDETTVYLQFSQLVRKANAIDPKLLDRIIPQIYCEQMLDWVMDIHPFRSIIYTLYADPSWTLDTVYNFALNTGVKCVTLHYTVATSERIGHWNQAGIIIGAHTNNDRIEAQALFDAGVDVMYTDFLTPDQFGG